MKKRFTTLVILLLTVIISLTSLSSTAYAASNFKIYMDSDASLAPQVGDMVTFSITVKNTSAETITSIRITETNTSKIFDFVDLVENSVEVNGIPVSYIYNDSNKSLEVTLLDTLAGEERVITFKGMLAAEGSFSRSLKTSSAGSIGVVGMSEVTVIHPKTYSVTYDANTGTGTVIDTNTSYLPGSDVTVLDGSLLYKENYTFSGWTLNVDDGDTVYKEGDVFTMPAANVVLYAKWVEKTPDPEPKPKPESEPELEPGKTSSESSGETSRQSSGETPNQSSGESGKIISDELPRSPETGDNSLSIYCIIIAAASMAAMIMLIFVTNAKKKKKTLYK